MRNLGPFYENDLVRMRKPKIGKTGKEQEGFNVLKQSFIPNLIFLTEQHVMRWCVSREGSNAKDTAPVAKKVRH
jgi:hypothetical protein